MWLPDCPPDKTGLDAGSTAIAFTDGFNSFNLFAMSDWFEYDGINNHYQLECETDKLDEIEKLLKQIEQNKRLSAKMDKLIYNLSQEIENKFIFTPIIGETINIDFDK